MKIEIDLKDILGDEYGNTESIAESIYRQVVENIQETLAGGIAKKINEEVSAVIAEKVKEAADKEIPSLMAELVDQEYRIVERYGSTGRTTTMRKELLSTLTEQMQYKKSAYDSDKNYFTRNIDNIVCEQMQEFKKQFNSIVNETFTKEAFKYAMIEMQKKLGMGR
jgi:5'-deoxynucleotidase YfbR-like HD superfamily hydrolase